MAGTCDAGGAGWGVGQGIHDCGYSEVQVNLPCLPYNGYYQEVDAECPLSATVSDPPPLRQSAQSAACFV